MSFDVAVLGQGGLMQEVFFFFCLFRAVPVAYGGSWARDLIGAEAVSLHHSHSNSGSKLHLPPTPQLTSML